MSYLNVELGQARNTAIVEGMLSPLTRSIPVIDPLDQPRVTNHPFAYSVMRGEILRVELTVAYGGVQVVAGLKFLPDLQFPLMYVKEIR